MPISKVTAIHVYGQSIKRIFISIEMKEYPWKWIAKETTKLREQQKNI